MTISLQVATSDRPSIDLIRSAAGGLIGLLLLTAIVIGWRRLDGGLSRPLELPALGVFAVAVASLAAAGRTAWRYANSERHAGRLDRAAAMTISIAVVAVGLAVGLPGTSPAGFILLWGVLAVEESLAWLWHIRRSEEESPTAVAKAAATGDPSTAHAPGIRTLPSPADADVMQQLTRSRAADGSETLSGWLRVVLSEGQRVTSVHVAFCPPFVRTPKVTIEQVDGSAARIKTVQLLPYGVRFDVKLSAVSPAVETLLLQFSAHCDSQP